MTVQERIAYINARGKLLQDNFEHMYSNNTELFNTKVNPFLNDLERMKYFIDRFNQYYNEETYDFMVWFMRYWWQSDLSKNTSACSQIKKKGHKY